VADFGVYLHIPFCSVRCDYCAFATWTGREHLIGDYLAALRSDVERQIAGGMPPATSVFVGGGTPSLVPAEQLGEVIRAVPLAVGAEVTVECNPDDVDDQLVAVLLEVGVNRISLGVQSTQGHVLASLGRHHRPEHVARAVEAIRTAGVPSFNIDLIYGAVGESVADWTETVNDVIDAGPHHVAAYGLMVEPGTPLSAEPDRHPDDDDQADKYLETERLLASAGLANYEISNWARPGHESKHNRLYWAQGDYAGIGCAAHSHLAGRRWWNVRTPERYIERVATGASTEAAGEVLDPATRNAERLQLALRTSDGVPKDAFDEVTLDELADFVVPHPRDSERVVLTVEGRLLANELSTRLVEPGSVGPASTDPGVSVAVGGGNVRRR